MNRTGSATTPVRSFGANTNIGTASNFYIRFLTRNETTTQQWLDFSLGGSNFSFYTINGTTLDYFGGNITDIPNALVANQTNLVLIAVDVQSGADPISLYVNPTLNQDGSIASTALYTTSYNIVEPNNNFVNVRLNFNTGTNENNWFDELAMGTELSDVVTVAVPEPGVATLAASVVAAAVAGTRLRRRS